MKLRTLALTAVLAASALALSGCLVVPMGPPVTQVRTVGSEVHEVVLKTAGDLVVSLGDEPGLSVTAASNVIDRITSESADGVLTLATVRGPGWFSGDVRFELTVTSLDALEIQGMGDVRADFTGARDVVLTISGAGDVEAIGIDARTVTVDIRGTGDVELPSLRAETLEVTIAGAAAVTPVGEVTRQDVQIRGAGSFKGEQLRSAEARVHIAGAGDVTVYVTEFLDASIAGAGSIRHTGGARVESSISGAGEISPLR